MKANRYFTSQSSIFWAYVRLLSQTLGYTEGGTKSVKKYTFDEIQKGLKKDSLDLDPLVRTTGKPNNFCRTLLAYFDYRADILNGTVKNNLMNKNSAEKLFLKLKSELNSKCPLPMNKQKGEKKKEAFFTCIVNMLIEKHIEGQMVDYDPRLLPIFVKEKTLVKTFSRRIDGAFPSVKNPIAVWEIKEYYYTTTFGSRVADAVYETLLDGLEINELYKDEGIKVLHYLFVDDHYTWWECGRSYLCRLIDLLHMGYIDELVIGKEVIDAIPLLVREWLNLRKKK